MIAHPRRVACAIRLRWTEPGLQAAWHTLPKKTFCRKHPESGAKHPEIPAVIKRVGKNRDIMQDLLVPGRECGGCTACCHALSIDAPTLRKSNGISCPHECGSGCSVYDKRPQPCRDWYCAWRLSDTLDDRWRPDRCGILVEMLFEVIPQGFDIPAVRFTLLHPTTNLFWPPFVALVTKALALRQPVFLCLNGPPGHLPAQSLLNVPALIAAAEAGEEESIRAGLLRARKSLEAHHRGRKSA